MKTLISIVLSIVLLSITLCYAEDRRTISVYKDGSYIMVPHVGECDKAGCVVVENTMTQWDGLIWLYQDVDTNGDGVCDYSRTWKPIADPTYGIFYTLYSTGGCR